MVFDHSGKVVAVEQKEHEQIYPQAGLGRAQRNRSLGAHAGCHQRRAEKSEREGHRCGWCDQPARNNGGVGEGHGQAGAQRDCVAGYPNGHHLQRARKDGGQDRFREKVGLPIDTYFSGPKIKWILDNVPGVRAKAEKGEVLFGNIDTWVIWNLTGGPKGGVHVTDVSNASRTMLMNLNTLDWDDGDAQVMGVPRAMLPKVMPSSAKYGTAVGDLAGIPVAGDLGDQQAALFGQTCFSAGEVQEHVRHRVLHAAQHR